eukprot:gene27777-33550_t
MTLEVALIVSGSPFHYEVVAFFGHHLKRMGYTVHAWLHPSSRYRYTSVAYSLIQPLVDELQFVPTPKLHQVPVQPPDQLDVLVYVTMTWGEDMQLLCNLGLHERLYKIAKKVIMVNHDASSVLHLHRYCVAPKCTLFHLAPHTKHTAELLLAQINVTNASLAGSYAVVEPQASRQLPEGLHRYVSSGNWTQHTRLVAIQGNMDINRRRYDLLFDCLRDLRSSNMDVRLVAMGAYQKGFHIPADLQAHVLVLESLSFPDFNAVLQRSHVSVMFANEGAGYSQLKSSSTVPTVVMNGVPVVLPRAMLSLYSCLGNMSKYQLVANDTDCSSLWGALQLDSAQAAAYREQTRRCHVRWLQEAQDTLRSLLAANVSSSASEATSAAFVPRCEKRMFIRPSSASSAGNSTAAGSKGADVPPIFASKTPSKPRVYKRIDREHVASREGMQLVGKSRKVVRRQKSKVADG